MAVPYRWVAMGVGLSGTFMVVLDTTIVNLALPALEEDFGTIARVEWVVTAYLLAVGIAQMTSGWVADRFGRKTAFVASMTLFTIGSALSAAAPTLDMLIVARALQGLGGGMVIPITMAMIFEEFEPEQRGRALGIFGVAIMAAPAIGPVLGGGIVTTIGWRWLFLVNVPIGVVGVPMAMRLLRDTGHRQPDRRLDRSGFVAAAVGLSLVLVGISEAGNQGWGDPLVLAMLAVGVVLLAWFGRHALRVDEPLVELRIFANPVFAVGMVVGALVTVVQFSRLVYIPLELGTTRDISELRIGLTMFPAAIGMAVTMPIGGRLTDRVGARLPTVVGLSIAAATFWPLTRLTPDTSLGVIAFVLFLVGLGSGLGMMPANIVALNAVPTSQVSQASGLRSVVRQLSAAMGTAMLATVLAQTRPDGDLDDPAVVADAVDAYNAVFTVAFVFLLASLAAAFALPGRRQALALQAERRAERETQEAADAGPEPTASPPPIAEP